MRQKFNYETITIIKTNSGEVFSPGDKVKMDYYVTGRLKIVTGIIDWINEGGNSGPAQIHLKDNPDDYGQTYLCSYIGYIEHIDN